MTVVAEPFTPIEPDTFRSLLRRQAASVANEGERTRWLLHSTAHEELGHNRRCLCVRRAFRGRS